MKIYLMNSLSKQIEEFHPIEKDNVKMYSCGPTVYNYAHIGNMRAFLFADLLQRVLKTVGGFDVKWVMNITNIDDKTIRGSSPGNDSWLPEMGMQTEDRMKNLLIFTEYYENRFLEDISSLGIRVNDFFAMPKATDYIPEMQSLIKNIKNKGLAYISEGSVYFNISEWRKQDLYGKLFNIDFDNFRKGNRIDADEYEKEQVSDFALWKAKKENEPYWEFELDMESIPGRPGWHIECSAMERKLLGLPFDIHTGGIDLKFPHHEDEIAQSKAGYGVEPTNFWCHNEFLEVNDEKMSKKLGNFYTIRDLIQKGIEPVDIRYAMLSGHYGSRYNFTFDGIKSAKSARLRIQEYIWELHNEITGNKHNEISHVDVSDLKNQVFSELAQDLHTPKALANLFIFINKFQPSQIQGNARASLIEFFQDLNNIFSAWKISKKPEDKIDIPHEIIEIAEKRLNAKKAKNFAEADSLRNLILNSGFTIKDTKDSYTIEKS